MVARQNGPVRIRVLTGPFRRTARVQKGFSRRGCRQGHLECGANLRVLPRSNRDLPTPIRLYPMGKTPRYCLHLSQPDTHLKQFYIKMLYL